jgi:phospholipase C
MTSAPGSRRRAVWPSLAALVVALGAAAGCNGNPDHARPVRGEQLQRPAAIARAVAGSGIAKIKHVIIVTQENRSFDSYFGT